MYSRYEQRRSCYTHSSGRRNGDGYKKGNGNDSGEKPRRKERPDCKQTDPKQTHHEQTMHKQESKTGGYGTPGPSNSDSVGTSGRPGTGCQVGGGFFLQLPPFLRNLLSGKSGGDVMVFLILLLLLWEGSEESQGTVLTLLLFLIL